MSKTQRRRTAEAVIAAFNIMDIDAIMSYRSPDCLRFLLPSTIGSAPSDNTKYRAQLEQLKPIFANFSLTAHDMFEDDAENRICMYLRARADTLAGEYINEYVWMMDFDDSGNRITRVKEFVDTVMKRDFFPRLAAAMKEHQAKSVVNDVLK